MPLRRWGLLPAGIPVRHALLHIETRSRIFPLDTSPHFRQCTNVPYEYDPNKSAANKARHGVDFEEAQVLWEDTDALQVRVDRPGEERYVVIGRMGGKHWTAVITYRGANTRIISVRRSRKEEVNLYEKA